MREKNEFHSICADYSCNNNNHIFDIESAVLQMMRLILVMGRRHADSAYPEEAKNKDEYAFCELNGFEEVSNSRLLCKYVGRDCLKKSKGTQLLKQLLTRQKKSSKK